MDAGGDKISRWQVGISFCAAICAVAITSQQTVAQSSLSGNDTSSVTISVQILPIANVEFPQGNGFELYIPSREEGRGRDGPTQPDQAPHLDIAEIPFEVRSNSRVTVEALPGEILEYLRGEVIGKAFPAPAAQANIEAGAVLPYRLRVEFPVETRGRAVPGFGNGRGRNPTGSHTSTANATGDTLLGIVYVVPDVRWGEVASRHFKVPGLYKGMVHITVSVGD